MPGMAKKGKRPAPPKLETYVHLTKRPMNCLVFVLPLLVAYHAGEVVFGSSLAAPHDINKILRYLGGAHVFVPGLIVVGFLVIQQVVSKAPAEVHPKVLAGMLGEAVVWTVPLIVIGQFAAEANGGHGFSWPLLVAYVGAGVYEEFLFRLLLISVVMTLLADLLGVRKDLALALAVLLGAMSFALYHFSIDQIRTGVGFRWSRFIFLAMAGTLWGTAFVFRGFGVAVGSHIVWNMYFLLTRG